MKHIISFLSGLFIYSMIFSQNAQFITDESEGCDLLVVQFDASSSSGVEPLTYTWDFDNGNDPVTETSPTARAIFNSPGTYQVELVVEDANGNKSSPYTRTINIYEGPSANFSYTGATSGCAPLTLDFRDQSTTGDNTITEWLWEFGDGSTSTEQHPSHTYSTSGNFNVSLYITDSKGCGSDITINDVARTTNSIRFDIEADKTYSCDSTTPLTSTFNPGLRYGTPLSTYHYLWDFGGGNTDTSASPTHTFNKGSHEITLTVSTKDGLCDVTRTYPGFINVGSVTPNITYGNTYPKCGMPTHKFTLENFGVGDNQKIIWDFGDGSVDTAIGSSSLSHQFTDSGVYLVRAYITDPDDPSCINVSSVNAHINIPSKTFKADNKANCNNDSIRFEPPDIWDADSYIWDFGDGNYSTEEEPVYKYANPGTYDVSLMIITRNAGCKLTFSREDFIHIGAPDASFRTPNGREISTIPVGYDLSGLPLDYLEGGCLSDAVQFVSNSSPENNIVNYKWIFGDGTVEETTTGVHSHVYTSEGVYSPVLEVTDAQGCVSRDTCHDCVRRGEQRAVDLDIITKDTVCCTFDSIKLYTHTPADQIDLVWYHLTMIGEEAGLPPVYNGFYKEGGQFKDLGGNPNNDLDWEDYFLTTYSIPEEGDNLGLDYYIFNNGCPTNIEYPEIQHHRLPWGNFLYTPPECEPNVDSTSDKIIFDLNDPAMFQGEWLAEENYPLDSAVISIDAPFDSTVVYRRQDYPGGLNFTQFQANNEFPVIVLDSSASGQFFVHTTLYDSDPEDPSGFIKPPAATNLCGPPGQACYDRVPVPIIKEVMTVNINTSSDIEKGCIPLEVNLNIINEEAVQNDSTLTWMFSNGQTARGPNPVITFNSPDTITYRLFGYDSSGCEIDSTFIRDTIMAYGVKADFMMDTTILCLTDSLSSSININNISTSSGTIIENRWDMAGAADTIINQSSFTYKFSSEDAPPTYLQGNGEHVTLNVRDDQGCEAVDSMMILLRKPVPEFIFGIRDFGCQEEAYLNLAEYSLIGGVAPVYGELHWLWDGDTIHHYKDLRSAHGTQIFIDQGEEGTYKAWIKITGDSLGYCPAVGDTTLFTPTLDTITAKINVNKTVFECPPAQIELNHDSTLLIDSIPIEKTNWEIYNTLGNTVASSELSNPTFTIREGGYYGVRVKIEDENGCSDIIEQDSLIHIKSLNGTIILPSDTICMGDSVSYNSSSTGATDFAWDFGEGNVFSGQQITYAYKQPGNRIVRLILSRKDLSGNLTCQETIQDTIMVKTAPVFSLNDTSICTGDTITLNVPDSSDYTYTWFPVASSSHSVSVSDSGIYSVIVRDITVNCSTTDSIHLTFNALPIISITTEPPVCIGETITLESSSSSPATSYYWAKDSLSIDSVANPGAVLNSPSTIYLTITDTNGCQNHTQKYMDIIEKPVLNLSDTNICPGDSVTLHGSPINQSYQNGIYEWYYNNELWTDSSSLSRITVKNEGQYMLIFSVGTCQSTGYSDIEYHPAPDITRNEELVVFCNTTNFATLDGGEAYQYEWAHSDSNKRYLKTNIEGTYYVTITNTEGCRNTDTIITDSRCGPLVMAPSAFIPGQQGDDKFYLHDYNIGDFHLYIFNRWGEIIFESKDPGEAWDGTYNGQLMPAGVYPWIMRYTGDNPDYNKKIKQQGSVTIIR